jgi:hypothetical protein
MSVGQKNNQDPEEQQHPHDHESDEGREVHVLLACVTGALDTLRSAVRF